MNSDLWSSLFKGVVAAVITYFLAVQSGNFTMAGLIAFPVFVAVGLASSIDYKLMHVRHEVHLVKHELQKLNDPQLKEIVRQAELLKKDRIKNA